MSSNLKLARRAIAEARRCGRDVARARALYSQAVELAPSSPGVRAARLKFLVACGEWETALQDAHDLRSLALERNTPALAARAARFLAIVCRELARWDEAARWQQRALRDDTPTLEDLTNRGNDALVRGHLRLAWRLFRTSLRAETGTGDPAATAADWGGLGNVAALSGRLALAERLYTRAYRLHRAARDRAGLTRDLLNLARMAAQRGDWTVARRRANLALRCAALCRNTSLHAEAKHLCADLPRFERAARTEPTLN
jgi:tetratricopeptide (TPR) repeat protein